MKTEYQENYKYVKLKYQQKMNEISISFVEEIEFLLKSLSETNQDYIILKKKYLNELMTRDEEQKYFR